MWIETARFLFVAHKILPDERDRMRQDLLDYCQQDTWATVRPWSEIGFATSGMAPEPAAPLLTTGGLFSMVVTRHEYYDGSVSRKLVHHNGKVLVDELLDAQ